MRRSTLKVLLRLVLAGTVACLATPVLAGPPPNDDFDNAVVVGSRRAPSRKRAPDGLDPAPLQERLELAAAAGVAELAEGLRLDLADPLAGDLEALAHFLERVLRAVADAEAHLDDALPRGG